MLKRNKIEKASEIIIALNCSNESFFKNLLKVQIIPKSISLNYGNNYIYLQFISDTLYV